MTKITVTDAPLPVVNPGDFVRFTLFCFGAKRPATGCILPDGDSDSGLGCTIFPSTARIEYQVALPPISELDEIYHRTYPEGGVFKGTGQIPIEQIEEVLGRQGSLFPEVPPPLAAEDLCWVRGEGAGRIVKIGARRAIVQLDSGKTASFPVGDLSREAPEEVAAVLTGYDAQTGEPTFSLMPLDERPTQDEIDEANWGHLAWKVGAWVEFYWDEATGMPRYLRGRGVVLGAKAQIVQVLPPAKRKKDCASFQVEFGEVKRLWVPQSCLRPTDPPAEPPALEPPPQSPRIFSSLKLDSKPTGAYQNLDTPVELPWALEELTDSKWRSVLNGALCGWNLDKLTADGKHVRSDTPNARLILHHVRVDHLPPEQQREWALFRIANLDKTAAEYQQDLVDANTEDFTDENRAEIRQLLKKIHAECLQELKDHPPVLGVGDWVELWRDPSGAALPGLDCQRGQVIRVGEKVSVKFVGETFSVFALAHLLRPLPQRDPLPFDWEPIGNDLPSDNERIWCICPANEHYGEPVTVDSCTIYGVISADEFFYFDELGRRLPDPQPPEQPVDLLPAVTPKSTKAKRRSPAGSASGWIEERLGNCDRPSPSVSHYYRFEESGKRSTRYIPVRKLSRVQQLIEEKKPVPEIIAFLASK